MLLHVHAVVFHRGRLNMRETKCTRLMDAVLETETYYVISRNDAYPKVYIIERLYYLPMIGKWFSAVPK